jgi:hypothetical protein
MMIGGPRAVQAADPTLNLKDGHSQTPHQLGNVTWILPNDASVDLAILPFRPDPKIYDSINVSVTDFVDHDAVLSEGDKIMLSGSFYEFPGVVNMQPIIGEGVLAMLPDEDLTATTGKPGTMYL